MLSGIVTVDRDRAEHSAAKAHRSKKKHKPSKHKSKKHKVWWAAMSPEARNDAAQGAGTEAPLEPCSSLLPEQRESRDGESSPCSSDGEDGGLEQQPTPASDQMASAGQQEQERAPVLAREAWMSMPLAPSRLKPLSDADAGASEKKGSGSEPRHPDAPVVHVRAGRRWGNRTVCGGG